MRDPHQPNKQRHTFGSVLWATVTVLGILVLMAAGDALDILQDGYPYEIEETRAWNVDQIDVSFRTEGCQFDFRPAIFFAAQEWDILELVDGGNTESIGFDGVNTVYCAESDLAALVSLPEGVKARSWYLTDKVSGAIIAAAHGYWENGVMLDCDIRFSSLVDRTYLLAAALHELGHCIAFDHSNEEGTVMHRYLTSTRLTLHVDDLLARCEVYKLCDRMIDANIRAGIPYHELAPGECRYGWMTPGLIWPDGAKAFRRDCR